MINHQEKLIQEIASPRFHSHSGLMDGWITRVGNPWTYVSATSFTTPGDQTAIFKKGLRLKWTQTTVKFGCVAADSTYGGGVTTVVLMNNSSYAVLNSAIDLPYITFGTPPDWTGFLGWAPTIAGYLNNPTGTVYRFLPERRRITLFIREATNGDANATTVTYTLPVTAANITNAYWIGQCSLWDNGTAQTIPGVLGIAAGATAMYLYKDHSFAATTGTGKRGIGAGSITYEY